MAEDILSDQYRSKIESVETKFALVSGSWRPVVLSVAV